MNLIGKKFNRLKVINFSHRTNKHCYLKCICSCGVKKIVRQDSLLRNGTKSCGCYLKEINRITHFKHGESIKSKPTVEYKTWGSIKERCLNRNNSFYFRYGGRGIKICKRWKNSFINFLKDMGRRPKNKTSIDRIDNNGNYTPSNCRWATQFQQIHNRGNSCAN